MGDRRITLPLVAVRRSRDADGTYLRDATTSDPANPVQVSDLKVSFYPYSSFGETPYSQVICPRLSREWSRRVCEGARTGRYADLPNEVTFLHADGLEMLWKDDQRPAARSVVARIVRLEAALGASDVECEPKPEENITQICHVAVALGARIVAVWHVPARDLQRAPNQAAAIATLFEHGLGPEEDVNALRRAFE